SPEVAAQIFPRSPIFDLVVFDEASQCRLEQALPVLLRGKRVLIAGDPQQLPPTRFFESQSREEEDAEADTDQELFEQQQAEVEDLLSAALNLSIEQSYLDVHYRSRNADLVEFSNQHFYASHLVPLPTSLRQISKEAPIRLIAVEGIYEQRKNVREAAAVVDLVRQLLDRPKPPTIGIACFNLSQRDAILEGLDDAADADPGFAERLETARTRQGDGSFEGLFVKNLENVQGDERDHIIISTTYGPDPKGKFYRRFGPLAQAGGGRRLNVLITRAREQIHVVTSIPAAVYRNPPALGDDVKPNGGWLLLAYLAFAEALNAKYQGADDASTAKAILGTDREPTPLAAILSQAFGKDGFTVRAPWGSAGLGGDLLLSNSTGQSLVVLCDLPGYARASNPVEWDLFRDSVLERQGFEVARLFSPRLLRAFDQELEPIRARLRSKC
ncbi:MAG: AAA domain-containing protein, partial [Myxococcales bacterium]